METSSCPLRVAVLGAIQGAEELIAEHRVLVPRLLYGAPLPLSFGNLWMHGTFRPTHARMRALIHSFIHAFTLVNGHRLCEDFRTKG